MLVPDPFDRKNEDGHEDYKQTYESELYVRLQGCIAVIMPLRGGELGLSR